MSEELFPHTILFVEDEEATRNNYVRFLNNYYSQVFEAKDGEEAYKVYLEKRPDILVIDIDIPGTNGLELLEKIRMSDYNTKAIMITAHSQTDYLLKATELKLTKYLIKPISRKELKDALLLVNTEINKYVIHHNEILEINNNFSWDIKECELKYNNKVIETTLQEKKILKLFFENIEKTMSYEKIIYEIWGEGVNNKINPLKTTIKNLRKKLPANLIQNIYGIGYKIVK